MSKKNVLFILSFSMALLVLQSCWKDKTLKDKDSDEQGMHIDISPAFGVPLLNLTVSSGDIIRQLDLSDSSANYYIEYDETGLCIIVYDKTNMRIALPSVLSFDTTVSFPVSFSNLQLEGISVKQARVNLSVDNGYTEDIHLRVKKLDYEDENGNQKPITSNTGSLLNANVVKGATSNNRPVRTQLFTEDLIVDDPLDIVKHATQMHIGFLAQYDTLKEGGSFNLNPAIKVPAWFKVENFSRVDTVKVDLSILESIFNDTSAISLQSATLYLTINNGLPMDIDLQLYFADNNYRILDSLQSEEIQIRSGQIHPTTYLLINPSSLSLDITLSKERFEKIKTAKRIILKEGFRTNGGSDTKLFNSNTFGVVLSAKANAKIDKNISSTQK